jgi:hypothetical protein
MGDIRCGSLLVKFVKVSSSVADDERVVREFDACRAMR